MELAGSSLVVSEVQMGYSGAVAGLKPGDRVLAAGPEGHFSPVDWVDWDYLEVKEGSLGLVSLRVHRGDQILLLELPPSPWGVKVRPGFLPKVLEAVEKPQAEGAREVLLEAAGQSPPSRALWLHLHLAEISSAGSPQREEAFDAALAAAEQAAQGFSRANNSHGMLEGRGLEILAWMWWRRGALLWQTTNLEPAREAFGHSIELLESRPLAQAAVLLRRGISFFNGSRQAKAQADFERAVDRIRAETEFSTNLAEATQLIAQCHRARGDLRAAAQEFARAQGILERCKAGLPPKAQLIYQLGRTAAARGDLAAAGRHYEEAVGLYETAGVADREMGNAYRGMGSLAAVRGDLVTAERWIRRSLEIFQRQVPGSPHHVWALRGLGGLAMRRGQVATAEELLAEALQLAEGVDGGQGATTAEVLWNLAELAEYKGLPGETASHYQRSLAAFERRLPGSTTTAQLRVELGRATLELGQKEEAREVLSAGREEWHRLAPGGLWEGWASFQLGRLAHLEARPEQAEGLLRAAEEAFHRLAPDTVAHAEIRHELALALVSGGRREEALDAFEAAIQALERQLPRLGSPEVGARQRAKNRALYDDYLQLLLEMDRPQEAFSLLERSRAQALLAMLAERDLVFRSALSPELDLERRRARSDYGEALGRLAAFSDRSSPEEHVEAQRALRLARDRQQQIRSEIRQQAPRLAELSSPRSLTVTEATAALDPRTLALSFFVGQDRTWVFALGRNLPLRVVEVSIGERRLAGKVHQYRRLLQNPSADEEPADSIGPDSMGPVGEELRGWLLEPLEEEIAAAQRVLFVPDGVLHLLPFGALPAVGGEPGVSRYFIEDKALHVVASIGLFRELAASRQGPLLDPGEGVSLVAFGDPETSATVPVRGQEGDEVPDGFPSRLLGARQEVERLAAIFGGRSRAFTGPEASEDRVRQLDPDTPLVHFATHSLVDERFPLDSALVLAPGGHDGLLQAWEIFEDLELRAHLVTLSACESALGEVMTGEGLMGLARAFHYAGAQSVLASLWPISDRSTAELMALFYQGLAEGLSKDEALRRAQIRLLSSPISVPAAGKLARVFRWFGLDSWGQAELDASHPRYWAAFQIYGNWL